MSKQLETRKEELLEKVSGFVSKRMSGAKGKAAQDFIDHYYMNVPPSDMDERDPEDLYGAAISMWTWGQTRKEGEAKIRVYNPRMEQHGWHSTHTVIEIVNDDMPFLVDSVAMELSRQNLGVHLVVHPVFCAERDTSGKLQKLTYGKNPKGSIRESYMSLEVDEQTSEEALTEIEKGLNTVLEDVRAAVEDWPSMREKAKEQVATFAKKPPKGVSKEEFDELKDYMQWIHDDNFTFLGYTEMSYGSGKNYLEPVKGSGLGLLRDPQFTIIEGLTDSGKLSADIRKYIDSLGVARTMKASRRSTVHRRVYMDTIAIKIYDSKGKATGERIFAGLFTSEAYNQSPREIPLLRRKVKAVVDRLDLSQTSSHMTKAILHVVENYPRDELFQISEDELAQTVLGIVYLQERQRIALFTRQDAFERFMSAIVYVPKDRFSSALRKKIGEVLSRCYEGQVSAHYTYMTDEPLCRVHFIIGTTPGEVPEVSVRDVETRVIEAGRTWEDKLRQALIESEGEERGLYLHRRYADAFPASYKDNQAVQTAIYDLGKIETQLEKKEIEVSLYHPIEAEDHQLRFKVFNYNGPVILSEIMPMLENMGLKVLEEAPYEIRPANADSYTVVHDFVLETADKQPVNYSAIRESFHVSFKHIWSGQVENDAYNRLVLTAGLDWQDVVIIRAYSKYLRQARIPFSQAYMEETLANNAELAGLIAKLFHIRFDPALQSDMSEKVEGDMVKLISSKLDLVENLDEDRILRRFLNIVQSTLRTSFFQKEDDGNPKSYVSFKLAAREIEDLPQPAPLREIFVYSPRFEAVHLRFGMVARGGLRWSDRREDFRTEILGLVKAQQVKNAVIVPVGSKGGFVLKKAPPMSDRAAFMEEGITCYKTFIQGMLDITDNLEGDTVVPPLNVVRKDQDDPYLVVAADKGTATFSDYSNEVSVKNGFWLGDAFASGGSAGYDHKKMGITARGAWESVKRHFREMGHDTQSQDFSVIGVGDMGGDVFGNGMLLSEHICLKAAFNHLHIFIDPTPDSAKTFKERKRLFEDVKGWDAYDQSLISKGGGIFDRKAKSISLTPEIKKMIGMDVDSLPPNQLISALLKAEIDLLWFGGIGTYIKHSDETDADAGDRANDSLRVNANELKCKVLGEGANLGVTHRARIQFAEHGGRVNTDAIDNSAGVDCSDHEVNIKILLGDVVARGDMTEKQRNVLLEEMTDEVAALVLRDNYQQTQSVSMVELMAIKDLDSHQRTIRSMERSGDLDRGLEFLPDDEEISDRLASQKGLSRPELSVILAYAKNITYQNLLESDLPDDPLLTEDLERYFPTPLRDKYLSNIHKHRLRREIIATAVTNSMINRTGPAFVNEMNLRTGMSDPDIARAYTITREVFGLRELWNQIEALDNKAGSKVQLQMLQETRRTINRMTEWFLRNEEHPLNISDNIERYKSGVATLKENLKDILGQIALDNIDARSKRFEQDGVPADLAQAIGQLKMLSSACDVVRLAGQANQPVKEVGQTYASIGTKFGLDWLRSAANRIPADSQWYRLALSATIDDLWGLQSDITSRVLKDGENGDKAIETWSKRRPELVERVESLLSELNNLPQIDLAMLAVVSRELRNLIN
ncbi:NAD-glutamate dehydrogenase [Curvivirga sp.]|uniref:NAD-glutamate dehydrogenase n=1 Tax=Curvivirga sp. TaxID=2856848 RepID=UPI003B594221